MNLVRYNKINSSGAIDGTARDLTASLWRNLRDKFIVGATDPQLGIAEFDDFQWLSPNTTDASVLDGYKLQNAVAGGTIDSFVTAVDVNGVAALTATTGIDWFGVSVARVNQNINTPKHTTVPKGDCAFGCRVRLDLSDHYFIGWGEKTEEFLGATGALPTDSDYIGFYRNDAGALTFVSANDNNGGTAVTYSATLLAAADIPDASAEWTKLEFRINKDFSVEIAVGGKIYTRDTSGNRIVVTPTALPIETLVPFYAETQRGATGDLATVALNFDWRAVAVEF